MKDKLRKLLLDARAIADLAEKEGRDFTAEEREQIEKLLKAAGDLKAELAEAEKDVQLRKNILALDAEFAAVPKKELPAGQPGRGKSIGERFVESEQFKRWMEQIAPGGHVPESTRGIHSPPVEYKSLFKDLITGVDDESAGAFVETDYTRIYEALGRYPLNVLQLINRRTTTSDLVHFVRQTQLVQEATPVPEANVTDYSGATGEISGEKPEGATAFEQVTTPVKTIAVWIPATKRALSDAAQIRGLIDQELRDDLAEELEDQLINGDGVGENFTGLAITAGILTQAWNTDILTTSRQAITNLQVNGRARATAWVIHPEDWETIELLQDTTGRYYWGGPLSRGAPQLWGVPVVTSQTLTQGTGYLGDWRKMVLWDREQANIQVSDSHADFFIRNMVAILAEMRAAMGVIRPTGFVEVAFESGS
ncbi:MAG TPA: phage major capsid protein [Anaerolineae bacterium]|nr:phage major capsid protein [Anaerolineae bacterium]